MREGLARVLKNARSRRAFADSPLSSTAPNRLLGQLDDTEAAFDDFWERHCAKLEQCLQLRHFERHFREVRFFEGFFCKTFSNGTVSAIR